MTKLDDAFDELEFNVNITAEMQKAKYLEEQREVATGVTDGTAQRKLVRDLTENLRTLPTSTDYNILRNDVLEEVAVEFAKLPFGDTASSFAAFVRAMKR
jgi:DNA primase